MKEINVGKLWDILFKIRLNSFLKIQQSFNDLKDYIIGC